MTKISGPDSEALFPILQTKLAPLVRRAAEAAQLSDGHEVEYMGLEVKSILNWSVSKRRDWQVWSINPYRGCEFACRYCYARYTHEFLEPKPEPGAPPVTPYYQAFEQKIFVKQHAAWLLEQELRKLEKQGRLPQDEIAIGTATDPYQPIERREQVTRSLLEVFARKSGLGLGIITKSTLIERDIDLLREIASRNRLSLHITITTPDAQLARMLEPRAPRPDLRFRTVARLRAAGLRVGVMCCPLMPGITDSVAALERMAKLSAQADACFMAANTLYLKPCSKPVFFKFIAENYPHLQKEYAERFAVRDFATPWYAREISARVAAVCKKHKLGQRRDKEALGMIREDKKSVASVQPEQRRLFA